MNQIEKLEERIGTLEDWCKYAFGADFKEFVKRRNKKNVKKSR